MCAQSVTNLSFTLCDPPFLISIQRPGHGDILAPLQATCTDTQMHTRYTRKTTENLDLFHRGAILLVQRQRQTQRQRQLNRTKREKNKKREKERKIGISRCDFA